MRILLGAIAAGLLLTVLAVGWATQTDRLAQGYAPAQPIPFSHRLHAGSLSIPCLHCHSAADRSRHAGIPAVEVCMECHRVTKTESPAIVQLKALFDSGRPLEWKRVHSLPDHVYFDHRPHVNAGVDCRSCHGPVEDMTVISQAMSLRMNRCLACHRAPRPSLPAESDLQRAPENCHACHR
ncbi:MAG TPA: cytochrome C [Elusimicrobia bacterium]|nr:cytochrome C [Elusimicrobiota bacterium]